MQKFNIGDVVSIRIPTKGEVGPIGLSGTITAEVSEDDELIYIASSHSGHSYWYPRQWLTLISKGAK